MKIVIESAIKLDSATQAEVEKVLKTKGEVEYKVNPSILGGLRVTMGGKRVDVSVSRRLSQSAELLNR